jgi:hypothetical protein
VCVGGRSQSCENANTKAKSDTHKKQRKESRKLRAYTAGQFEVNELRA